MFYFFSQWDAFREGWRKIKIRKKRQSSFSKIRLMPWDSGVVRQRWTNVLVACASKETLRTNGYSASTLLHSSPDHRGLHLSMKPICPFQFHTCQTPVEKKICVDVYVYICMYVYTHHAVYIYTHLCIYLLPYYVYICTHIYIYHNLVNLFLGSH